MKPISIYLAGSIDGLTYEEATGWRIEFAERLHRLFGYNIVIFDPTLKLHTCNYKPDDIIDIKYLSRKEMFETFENDIRATSQTDIGVINIQGKSKGTGTIFEIGYMYAKGVKMLGYIDKKNPLKQHPFINNAVDLYISKEAMLEDVIRLLQEAECDNKNHIIINNDLEETTEQDNPTPK